MKVVIVEDEHLAATKLEKMVLKCDPSVVVIKKLDAVESALLWFQQNDLPDLLFLDIQLTDGTSFDLLKQVDLSCPIIFTTAYDDYALDAFEHQSIDYLIKPISQEKLCKALDKLKQLKDSLQPNDKDYIKLLDAIKKSTKAYKSRFLVKTGSIFRSVSVADIAYFYSHDKLVFLKTKNKQQFVVSETLDELESILNPLDFFRVNRQYIINFESIVKVHPHFNDRLKIDFLPTPNEDIYVSNRRASMFKDWMDK